MSHATRSLAEVRALYTAQHPGTRTTLPAPTGETQAAMSVEPAAIRGRVGVLGVAGGVGVSTVALALAEGLDAHRLVEFGSPRASGLAAAPTAELGEVAGWSLGTRGELRIERRMAPDAPTLDGTAGGWEVIDFGAVDPSRLSVCAALVVVANCSIPGMRGLEAHLGELTPASPVSGVITGVPGRRLPRPLSGALGPHLRTAAAEERLFLLPECPDLRIGGISSAPLPTRLRSAVPPLVAWLEDPS